jgi:hypothetical protein
VAFASIDQNLLKYKINEAQISEDSLIINVQYGGGAIKPHEFELVQVNNDSAAYAENTVCVFLLHKTLNDKGRAILRTRLSYDLKSINARKKNILLNGTQLITKAD